MHTPRAVALSALVAIQLAACQPAEPAVSPAPAPAAPALTAASADVTATLAGEYRVAAIDGAELAGGIGIALTITATTISFEPRCAGFVWSYSHEAGALITDRPQKPRPRSEDGRYVARPVRPVCRIAVHPEQRRLAEALDAVTQARITASNGLELRGGGRSVTLFSQ